jgi:hypothetical protein
VVDVGLVVSQVVGRVEVVRHGVGLGGVAEGGIRGALQYINCLLWATSVADPGSFLFPVPNPADFHSASRILLCKFF